MPPSVRPSLPVLAAQVLAAQVLAALVLAALVLAGAPAHAARPLVTEDAPVQAAGDCAIEVYHGRSGSQLTPPADTLSAQLACGVSANTQLAATLARVQAGDTQVQALQLAGKSRLWPRAAVEATEADAGAELALAYGLVLNRPRQASAHWTEAYALLAASLPLASGWKTHLNLGWSGSREARANTTTWAAALEWAPREGLSLSAEAFANDRERRPWRQLGISQALGEQLSINASLGRQGRTTHALTVGLTVGF